MADTSNLARSVAAGEIIKPWLVLGPFYEDVFDRVGDYTYHRKAGTDAGREVVDLAAKETVPLFLTEHHEGEIVCHRGDSMAWRLVRGPEQHLSWGRYFLTNHLVTAVLHTRMVPDAPGRSRCRLLTRIHCRVLVAVNGALVYEGDSWPGQGTSSYPEANEHAFQVELAPGENAVSIALVRVGRMARVGCRLELDRDVQVHVPLSGSVTPEDRAVVEREMAAIRLARDVYHPDHTVGLHVGARPSAETPLRVRLLSESGVVLREATPADQGDADLCTGSELSDGEYLLEAAWLNAQGDEITSIRYDVTRANPVPEMMGDDRYDERCRIALDRYATMHETSTHQLIWPEVAKVALGRFGDVSVDAIRETCDWIAQRKDCADFAIHGLLRIMYWERDRPRLSAGINAMMKETILGWEYWPDEPRQKDMIVSTENHRLLCHVAEWMAGQLFPVDEFTNSLQRGLYHATKGRMHSTEWLRQRGRFGFDEWHSNSYFPVDVAPLLNVYDFCLYEDYKLKQMAQGVLDYIFAVLAMDSLRGVFGATHGRSYGRYVKYPDLEGTAPMNWVLYGTGALGPYVAAMGAVSLASSDYRPPPLLARMANDDRATIWSRQRQGLLRGDTQSANFCVYRTPDYLISGLQDHRKGEYETSTHVAQVTLRNKAVIFWSCPDTQDEGSGQRPDYWSGNTALPRVIQERNVMSLTCRLNRWAWMSHCWFPVESLDNAILHGAWAFARAGQGYVGIWSQNGMALADTGRYAGRELVCTARENTWLVECGREADWGSFSAFVGALLAAPVAANQGVITYQSPSIGCFVTGWDATPTVNDEPIQLRGYPMLESKWGDSRFGSGEMSLRYGDETYEIWFNQ